jgi:Zn-dependent oligopeptidase
LSSESSAAHLATAGSEDLTSATEAAIANARAGIDHLKAGDFASAVAALETFDEAFAELGNVSALSNMVANSHPDEAVRSAAEAAVETISKVITDISLDPEVYRALSVLDVSDQDEATQYYLMKTLREFRRAGVDRDDATRARIRELKEEMVGLGLTFERNIRTDTKTLSVDPSALDGLPADFVRAHPAGADGQVSITTDYPDLIPFMTYSRDGSAREALLRLDRRRAYPANVDVFAQLLKLRQEFASLLGYATWAQYITEDKMIGSDKAAADFIARISEAATDRAGADYAELLTRKQVDDPAATAVDSWDRMYLSDRLKAEKLAFDTQSVRPYFEYNRVKAGLMGLLERMFGIRFAPCTDVPVWHEDVEAYDVTWADSGTQVGRIFLDMHPRDGKFNHAACFTMTVGKETGDPETTRIPECALLCNLPKPGADPALLQHSDVTTFFHEFGHLIHHIIGGHQRWSGVSGIENEWDFVEAPSQLLEEWTFDAETLATFATHVDTGEPLPAEIVAKLREADEFGKGLQVRQQMFYATLSLEAHRANPDGIDVLAIERTAQETHTPFKHVDGTFMYLSFGHLEGYSALYYTYMWSLVIAKDLFTRFAAEGLPAPRAAAAYRDAVLAPGGTAPAAELVRNFLGRDYTFDAYKAWLDR